MKQMLLFFLIVILLFADGTGRKCCSKCTCSNRCEAPDVHATLNSSGLVVHCPQAECACVTDELDTCTYGEVWENATLFDWHDSRWRKCIRIESVDPLEARALVRWWHGKCMGHINLHLKINLQPVSRDLFVDFNVLAFFEHDTVHNVFHIRTESGSSDERPLAGSSDMFFDAQLHSNHTGVHVEITNCTVQIIEGKSKDAAILNQRNVYDPNNLQATDKGMRMTYKAFWDDETNSPFQRLVCKYALFNGTTNDFILHNTVNRTYMIADPNEKGVLMSEDDAVIQGHYKRVYGEAYDSENTNLYNNV